MPVTRSPIASMTGFGATAGIGDSSGTPWSWAWELRSVNARGLELRFRLPPGLDRLEAELRGLAGARLKRGTIAASLRMTQPEQSRIAIDRALLASLAQEAASLADATPGTPRPRIELLMALPGVVRRDAGDSESAPSPAAIEAAMAGFTAALEQLAQSRLAEGARLCAILETLLDQLAALHGAAQEQAAAQSAGQKDRLAEILRTLLAERPGLPEDRLAQELALLASRADVTEELDRLGSHITAARDLLAAGGPQGRPLDFLVQEFMREANTLCSKSASIPLTATGLQIKAVIEQIREQVQNIE